MRNSRVKRSHIVPKFYLRGFCMDRDERVWVGDLRLQQAFIGYIRDVGVHGSFYEAGAGKHEDDLEKRLANIESDAAPHLRSFLRANCQIGPELTRFIAWLAARTYWLRRKVDEEFPAYLAAYLAANRESLEQEIDSEFRLFRFEHVRTGAVKEATLKDALAQVNDPDWRMQVTQDQHLDAIRLQAYLFQSIHFPKLNWVRAKAPNELAFITSDRPVCWSSMNANVEDSPSALNNPDIQLTLPLNLSVALVAGHGQEMRVWTVDEINYQTCLGAERFVYGHSKEVVERWMRQRSNDRAH